MDFTIPTLGKAKIQSTLKLSTKIGDKVCNFVQDTERVLYNVAVSKSDIKNYKTAKKPPLSMERAGPREMIYFDPSKLRCGIVTCGGLCPGINNVIRAIVMELYYHYRTSQTYGFRFGYAGLVPKHGYPVVDLNPTFVQHIHHDGGSILGSSRGPQETTEIVDALERMGIGLFFIIGGDGTLRGAQKIYEEITRRKAKISVIGIPKTIDNDIMQVEKTFGFETAFSIAIDAIRAAHVEAEGAPNGIGIVRVMGRHSGYIAANAALAEPDVNLVLVPEVPFQLEGENGLIAWLKHRIKSRGHAAIVAAEGAGQELLQASNKHDPSGNVRLGDIGMYLKHNIASSFDNLGIQHSIKYIDPSYLIRSAPAYPNDSLFCSTLAQNAVHAGMSGRTGMIISMWNGVFTHVPITEAVVGRKVVDPEGELWRAVLETTGQPHFLR